jgi:hypothetical protein
MIHAVKYEIIFCTTVHNNEKNMLTDQDMFRSDLDSAIVVVEFVVPECCSCKDVMNTTLFNLNN